MKKSTVLCICLIAAGVTMACSLSFLPFKTTINVVQIETGPMVTEEINVPVPAGEGNLQVELLMAIGELNIEPGDPNTLLQGTVRTNVETLEPTVLQEGGRVRLLQGDEQGAEGFQITVPDLPTEWEFKGEVESVWDLRLGTVPLALNISTGAMETTLELGGLSLTGLSISQGVSDFQASFSTPNQVVMESMHFNAGASNASLIGLANTNAEQIIFKGGAGSYTLDFSGELARNLNVQVDAGVGEVVIIVPQGVSAQVRLEGGLTDVDAFGVWQRVGDQIYLDGDGPSILLEITMGVGHLELRNR